MRDIKPIVAENLAQLRKNRGLTQAELAEMFDYSDKAISRWERGDTMPDINVLYDLCEFYGVTLDYLVHKGDEHTEEPNPSRQRSLTNRIVMTALVVSIIWLAVTVMFVYGKTFKEIGHWQLFVWAVPMSCAAIIITSRKWVHRIVILCIWSLFVWSLLASIYLQFLQYNFWMIFIIGVPAQIIIILWYNFKNTK